MKTNIWQLMKRAIDWLVGIDIQLVPRPVAEPVKVGRFGWRSR